jgi:hypothetical protein
MQHYLSNQDSRQIFQASETQSGSCQYASSGAVSRSFCPAKRKPARLDGHYFKVVFFMKKTPFFLAFKH